MNPFFCVLWSHCTWNNTRKLSLDKNIYQYEFGLLECKSEFTKVIPIKQVATCSPPPTI